jgi:hypothetical protein
MRRLEPSPETHGLVAGELGQPRSTLPAAVIHAMPSLRAIYSRPITNMTTMTNSATPTMPLGP